MSHPVANSELRLAQKIVTRVVHDMVSPIGAISNGVELLSLMANGSTDEIALIEESCATAASRLRIFRLAFGRHNSGDMFSQAEAAELVKDCTMDGRCRLNWQIDYDVPRLDAQLAVLAMLCFRTALPRGGDISITAQNGQWTISCNSETTNVDRSLWHVISGMNVGADVASMQVQFMVLRLSLLAAGKDVDLDLFGSHPILRF